MWMFVWLTASSCSPHSHKHSLLQACALRMTGFLPQHLITCCCHFQLGVRRERCKAKFTWGMLWYKVIFSLWLLFPSSGTPPLHPAQFWMLIFEGRCSPGGQDAGARPQEAPCASPSLSSAVSRASPDLNKILSPALLAVSLRLLCPESLPAPREGLSYLPTSSLPCFSGEWLLNCFSEDTYYRVTFSHSNSLIQRNSSYQ